MSTNAGGPAFPVPLHEDIRGNYAGGDPGMTMLDYFAAKAMQGILANPVTHTNPKHLPGASYAMGQAMLAERAKQTAVAP